MKSLLIVSSLLVAACTAADVPAAGGGGLAGTAVVGTPVEAPGIDRTVTQLAPPTKEAGPVPVFRWEAVQGAHGYLLVVQGPDGRATWAWRGEATSVPLGGVEGAPSAGTLEAGSLWSVAALDAQRHVIAVSPLRPASP